MKKVLSVVLAVMMLASLSAIAFADVNPSVTTKAAPAVDESSVEVEGVDEGTEVTVTLTSAVPEELAADASEEEKAEFEQKKAAVEAVLEEVSKDASLTNTLDAAVAVETTSELADVYVVSANPAPVVSDVFYFDAKDQNGESVLATEYVEGETPAVKVQVKVDLPKNLMKVLQKVGGTWIEVPVVLNDAGEPVLELSYAGPIVFVVDSNVEVG